MKRPQLFFVLALIGILGALIGVQVLAGVLADWWWFGTLHLREIFVTEMWAQFALLLVVGVFTFAFLYGNLAFAQRGAVPHPVLFGVQARLPIDLSRLIRRLTLFGAVAVAVITALAATGAWLTVLRFLHPTSFGVTDPAFGHDVGYYVFKLPFLSAVLAYLEVLVVLALAGTIPLYALRRDIVVHGRRVMVEQSAAWHLASLLAGLFVLMALSAWFIRLPSLVFSTGGPLFGASYTDLTVRAPLIRVLAGVLVVAAVIVLAGARSGRLARNAGIAAVLYIGLALAGSAAAVGVQKLIVAPNELQREAPQIAYHIAATRRAWDIDSVQTRDLSGEAQLSLADIEANAGTIRNVRLWDRAPLLQTFQQLQEIRTYYDFKSVDDDRYWINGQYRQVLLSARELNSASLPTRNFINEHLTYTHGMGLTLSPPNEVTSEGLPVLFVKDLPPTSDVSLTVKRPGIYYGEMENEYVIVHTAQREFDYPLGDSSAFTTYAGAGGVPINSLFRRLIMSLRYGSMDILFTGLITSESRIMYHRNVEDRVRKAFPFLMLDSDPYLVITPQGHLVWIVDCYTATTRYPYSQPLQDGTNYLRNSVKVVVDAYDGTVQAYTADPNDPLLSTYAKIFPDIFQPMSAMPDGIKAHVRYATDLFRVQAALYTTYHMHEPDVFYAREDQWQIPALPQGGSTHDPFLRHMIMRLPGERTEEYITMTPFTPRGKDNLAAWMVARSDGPHYGQLAVYRFPKQSLVYGPSQIENRINQDTEISQQISLWDQRGSQVIRGNLLVIPIGESLIFVQALYLRAQGGRIPELKRVIVAYQNRVVMAETLDDAMSELFGGAVGTAAPRPVAAAAAAAAGAAALPSGATGIPPSVTRMVRELAAHYDSATVAQRAGDWARYGDQMRAVQDLVQRLRDAVGAGGRN